MGKGGKGNFFYLCMQILFESVVKHHIPAECFQCEQLTRLFRSEVIR